MRRVWLIALVFAMLACGCASEDELKTDTKGHGLTCSFLCRQSGVSCTDTCTVGSTTMTCGDYGQCTTFCGSHCDCPSPEVCNPSTNVCELDFGPYPECRETCDCNGAQWCVNGVCA